MRVIVTRPEREGARWMQALQERGLEVLALPLLVIGPAPDPKPLRQAWLRLDSFAAVMFVSANAVEHFFKLKPTVALTSWTYGAIKTRAWAPGPGTAEALETAGLDVRLIDAPSPDAVQFDSEALWKEVHGQVRRGERVLIVRGGDSDGGSAGREWLAAQLEAAGVDVESVVAYIRHAPVFDAAHGALARAAATDGSVWLFSSSEAVANLVALLPGVHLDKARAIASHPRIAQAARQAGFGVVCESRPGLDAVTAALELIR